MASPLDGVRSKLARGAEHLDLLKRESDEFAERKEVHGVVFDHDPKTRIARAIVKTIPPPLRLGIIAGEAIQQYRSALDHLAYQLVILRHPNAGGPNFPIFTDRNVYETRPFRRGRIGRSPRDHCRRNFRPDDLALIERFQPYNAPRPLDDTLAILQRWSNLDKHEVIHVGHALADKLQMTVKSPDPNFHLIDAAGIGAPLENGTVLCRWRGPSHGQMHMDVRLRVDMWFGHDRPLSVEMLKSLGLGVVGIVDEFERSVTEFRST